MIGLKIEHFKAYDDMVCPCCGSNETNGKSYYVIPPAYVCHGCKNIYRRPEGIKAKKKKDEEDRKYDSDPGRNTTD